MVTLTLTDEAIADLTPDAMKHMEKGHNEIGLENAIATIAIRRFTERWRKEHKKSIRHWVVTEKGQTNTERIHMHGIIFTNANLRKGHIEGLNNKNKITINKAGHRSGFYSTTCYLAKKWQYGMVHIGEFCTQKTISYIVKYITKKDELHPDFKPRKLISNGIGRGYTDKNWVQMRHRYKGKNTVKTYQFENGHEASLPVYYKNKLWTDEERTKLWMIELDKEIRWIGGQPISISTEEGLLEARRAWGYEKMKHKLNGYKEGKWRNTRDRALHNTKWRSGADMYQAINELEDRYSIIKPQAMDWEPQRTANS
jgi:hypothetical protein